MVRRVGHKVRREARYKRGVDFYTCINIGRSAFYIRYIPGLKTADEASYE